MYNGPIYNRSGRKIGELRGSGVLANPLACLIVALIPVALVITIVIFIFQLGVFGVHLISNAVRGNQVTNAIGGGATHYFSESRSNGNVVVNNSGYWLGNRGASATFDINAQSAGSYNLTVYAGVGSGSDDTVDVSVNGGSPTTMQISPNDSGYSSPLPCQQINACFPIAITLQVGGNTITFSNETYGDSCDPQHTSTDGLQGPTNCTFIYKIVLS